MSSSSNSRSQRTRRSPNRTPKASLDIADTSDDFIIISKDPYFGMPDSRPSLGSEHHSEMGDSNMSHDPLLSFNEPFSRYEKPEVTTEPPLLTSNKLDPIQRKALIRQSRKIHKLLGETPQIAEIQQLQPLPPRTNNGNKLQRRPTLAGSDVRLDRSAAVAALESPGFEPPPDSKWGKVASSLVATPGLGTNANVPFLQLNVVPSPDGVVPPIRQRRLSDSSVASSSINSILSLRRGSNTTAVSPPSDRIEHNDNGRLQKNAPKSSRSNIYIPPSPTSPPPSQSATLQRQQTRARMAKIQQLMGETVPSELVMGPRPNQRSRRLSMESRVPSAPPAQVQALKHKRSKSMWKKDSKDEAAFDSAPETTRTSKGHGRTKSVMPPIEDLLLRQLQTPMSDKQKALNVKRALKMAAVFGVPPPQALYQDRIGSHPSHSLDSVASRQSLASLAYMLDHDRDSLYDLLANAEDSGSDSDQDPVDWPYEHKPRSDSLPESQATKGSAKYTIAGRYPDMAPPTPPFRGSFEKEGSVNNPSPQVKPKATRPPPLTIVSTSTSVSTGNDGVTRKASKRPVTPGIKSPSSDTQFMARRRRANKLSRFFGVGYNDLFNFMIYESANVDGAGGSSAGPPSSSSLVPPVPPLPSSASPLTPKASAARANLTVPGSSSTSTSGGAAIRGGTVLVETGTGKATVLRTSTNMAADVDAEDLGEMMAKLRSLRA